MDDVLAKRLDELGRQGLTRSADLAGRQAAQAAADRLGVAMIDAATNDYLGLADAPSAAQPLVGSGASRLVHGTRRQHEALEHELAAWLGTEAALLFATGYAANAGLLPALADADDCIVSDALNHASIVDGCRLSRAEVRVYPHLDLAAAARELERPCRGKRWWITESYFSMDGDGPDLVEARRLADAHGAALIVDEAHSVGVFGPHGRGRLAASGVRADALVVTFGKALGAQGAAILGSTTLRRWLVNRARTFIYSTAPSPTLCSWVQQRVAEVRRADALRVRLHSSVERLQSAIAKLPGVSLEPALSGPIVPVVFGEPGRALAATYVYASRGILVQAIRPPTVPVGTARIRLCMKASFSDDDVARLIEATEAACNAS